MMIELEQSFYNRTGRQNDKSDRGHETPTDLFIQPKCVSLEIMWFPDLCEKL